jgi:hypothetical protein
LSVPTATKKRRVGSKSKTAKRKIAKSHASKSKVARSSSAIVRRPSSRIEQPSPEEKAAFTQTLIESGQAAVLDKEGRLPPGATHKIIEDKAGTVKVVRRRFSIA